MTAVVNWADSIINMESGPLSLENERFYKESGKFLLRAIFYYMHTECLKVSLDADTREEIFEKDFIRVQQLLNEAKIDEEGMSYLDIKMELLNKTIPNHPAYLNYREFKKADLQIQNEIINATWGQLMWWNAHKNMKEDKN